MFIVNSAEEAIGDKDEAEIRIHTEGSSQNYRSHCGLVQEHCNNSAADLLLDEPFNQIVLAWDSCWMTTVQTWTWRKPEVNRDWKLANLQSKLLLYRIFPHRILIVGTWSLMQDLFCQRTVHLSWVKRVQENCQNFRKMQDSLKRTQSHSDYPQASGHKPQPPPA